MGGGCNWRVRATPLRIDTLAVGVPARAGAVLGRHYRSRRRSLRFLIELTSAGEELRVANSVPVVTFNSWSIAELVEPQIEYEIVAPQAVVILELPGIEGNQHVTIRSSGYVRGYGGQQHRTSLLVVDHNVPDRPQSLVPGTPHVHADEFAATERMVPSSHAPIAHRHRSWFIGNGGRRRDDARRDGGRGTPHDLGRNRTGQ